MKQACKGVYVRRLAIFMQNLAIWIYESSNTKQGLLWIRACTTFNWGKGHFKSSISCHKSPWFDWFDWLTGSTVWTCTQLIITGSWRLSLSKTQVNSVLGRRSLLYQKLANHVSNETECRPLTMLFTRASKWRHWSRASGKDKKSRKKVTYFKESNMLQVGDNKLISLHSVSGLYGFLQMCQLPFHHHMLIFICFLYYYVLLCTIMYY